MPNSLRWLIYSSILICLQAHADQFRCSLLPNTTTSTDANFVMPEQLLADFGQQGEAMTLINPGSSDFLNCRLPIEDRLDGGHLFFGGPVNEGVTREADVIAGSPDDFIMTITGVDEARKWSGQYDCVRIPKPATSLDSK